MIRLLAVVFDCLVAIALVLVAAEGTVHAELVIQPALTASEEYNDNVLLQHERPLADYITRVAPELVVRYQTSFWLWDGMYTYEYRYFNRYHDLNESNHISHVRNLTEIVRSFLFFEGIDDFRRVSLDVTNDYTQQSPVARQTDQHTLTLHPYMVLRLGQSTTVQYGHKIIDTRYRSGEGINRIDNIDYLESSTSFSSNLTTTIGARHTKEENTIEDFDQNDVYAGLRYAVGESSTVFGQGMKSWFHYDKSGNTSQYAWNAGINHRIIPYSISLESGVTYLQDPTHVSTREDFYRVILNRDTERSSLSLAGGLREFKNMTTNEITTITRESQGTFIYRLTPRLTGTARSLYQNIEDRPTTSHIYLSLSSLRFDYQLTEKIRCAAEYSHLRSYAPVIAVNNYTNNRGLIELRMLF